MSDGGAVEASLFPGALAPFRSTLLWDDDRSVPTLDRSALPDVLARFQRSVGGAWQPASSFWAQLYFNTVVIPATCLLAGDAHRTLHLAAITATVCPVSGTPLQCAVQVSHPVRQGRAAGRGLAAGLAEHLGGAIVDLHAVGRLSKGLLRESAERVLHWTLAEIGAADPARATIAMSALSEQGWPVDPEPKSRVPSSVRRFCCLRDRLPNIPPCGDACPRGGGGPGCRRHR